eukprot:GHRR01025412.1.p1 GENE.GHRR01025412.1~~GHRR01025412.1.p1  ORF type:complete len:203 (+),score=56.98 GHRR01025412.1:317-925(+)
MLSLGGVQHSGVASKAGTTSLPATVIEHYHLAGTLCLCLCGSKHVILVTDALSVCLCLINCDSCVLSQSLPHTGVTVAVCSTSNERAVSTIVKVLLGGEIASVMRVFAGDIVPKKKPAPDIYLLAAKELGLNPARCVVIEDSRIGMLAAKSAGMTCVITKSSYTQNEDFSSADAVYSCIGDSPADGFSLADLSNLLAISTAA